jgi:hypothetical protein
MNQTYFAQIGHDGPIKIGVTSDVKRRLKELQTNVPWRLRLLLVTDQYADYEIYHSFSASRMRAEWFYPTAELLAFIKNPHKLDSPTPETWADARRTYGTNLTFMRRVVDICIDHLPPCSPSIEKVTRQ